MRVRFAPSPTGYLHVGGARTAIFNYLIARKAGGTFVLRIEDTDEARNSQEMVDLILDSLTWLGLTWDEGPFFQSRRTDLYLRRAAEVLASGAGYRCYCTVEELEAKKARAEAEKRSYKYDGTCRDLSPEERARRDAAGMKSVVRVRVPEGATSWNDSVQGPIEVKNETIDDFVLLRSDGTPTYHLSVVADDVDMGITHVLRGVDHISNTPKQLLLYRALDAAPPRFGHLPLILGPDKKKLSKRHGIASVGVYRDQGILPEALFNFLALLGWSPGGDRELMTRDEMIAAFAIEDINKANAVFDLKKLEWMNSQYVSRLPEDIILPMVEADLRKAGAWQDDLATARRAWLLRLVDLLRPRSRVVADVARDARPFLTLDYEYDEDAVKQRLSEPGLAEHVRALVAAFSVLLEWDEKVTDETLRRLAGERGIKPPVLIHALRVALTGKSAGPSLFAMVAIQGKEGTLARLAKLDAFLSSR